MITMKPHSSALAWKIPWTEEPGGLQSMRLLRVRRLSDFTLTFHFHALEKEMATHSSILSWRIPGTEEPGGLPSTGSHRVGHDGSDLAAAAAYIHNPIPSYPYRSSENGLMDTAEEGVSETNGESSINIYTLSDKMDSKIDGWREVVDC